MTIPRVADFFKEEHREARVELIDSAMEFARKIQGTAELSYGKSKQEDKIRYEICLPLVAHVQELYLFVTEYGLILNQELNLIKRTQWQKD